MLKPLNARLSAFLEIKKYSGWAKKIFQCI